MLVEAVVLSLGQGLVCLALAPFMAGCLRWARCRLERRQGPRLWQPYRDLWKLLHRRGVTPAGASWVFFTVPAIAFSCYAALACLAPVFYLPPETLRTPVDLLLIVYLLGLARLAEALAGLGAGSPIGGLGSSRQMFLHALTEPALVLIVAALALVWHTSDLRTILTTHPDAIVTAHPDASMFFNKPGLLLLIPALCLVILAEAGRLPFDNPDGHLELTMFGQSGLGEYAGPELALLNWAEWIRLTFLVTLLANMFAPWLLAASGQPWPQQVAGVLLYPGKLLVAAVALATWESLQVKNRLRGLAAPAVTALVIAAAAIIVIVAK